jgi:hypothetical protein
MANGIGASLTNYQSNMLREHNRAMDLIPDKASLRRRETRFCGAETNAPKRSQQFNRQIAETKCGRSEIDVAYRDQTKAW